MFPACKPTVLSCFSKIYFVNPPCELKNILRLPTLIFLVGVLYACWDCILWGPMHVWLRADGSIFLFVVAYR